MTAQPPQSTGTKALAGTLRDQQQGLAAVASSTPQYLLDSSGNARVIWGQDISYAPIAQYGANPTTEATGLSGPGIATKKSGSWVQIA